MGDRIRGQRPLTQRYEHFNASAAEAENGPTSHRF